MSGQSLWTVLWPVLGLLAVEAALLVSIAALIARCVTTAAWRRTVWQGCILALLGLLALEISGGARYMAAFATGKGRAEPGATETPPAIAEVRNATTPVPLQAALNQRSAPVVAEEPLSSAEASEGVPLPAREDARPTPLIPPETSAGIPAHGQSSASPSPPGVATSQGSGSQPVPSFSIQSRFTSEELTSWLVLSWFSGALVFIAINAFARLSFAWLRRRCPTITDPAIRKRVEALAGRMGLRRPIRLFESARLVGPVAAGTLRPAIGLPARFTIEYTPAQQEVMLAHEVAHLAANDPLWSRLADILAALLWWHPLAWWARRQLHAASETAADESSLLMHDGPRVLAECLVALGGRLTRRQPVGWMGVEGAGFRSALGRRVERLLHLPAREWARPRRIRCALACTLAPAALVAAVILCTAWTVPQPSTYGDRMKTPVWNRSLPLYALLAALWTPDPPAVAADAPKSAQAQPAAAEPVHSLLKAAAFPVVGAEGAAKLKAKLDSIVLDQIAYDSLPLNQVVESLMKEAAAKDPEKVGVNFLFGQPAEPIKAPAAIDPATGLPFPSKAVIEVPDVSATMIRIAPPLKKVRLIDALDAIKRVADQPITYTVEGYAVVFNLDAAAIYSNLGLAYTPRPPPPVVQAFTRSFKLDTNTFFVSVKKMLGRQIEPASERVGEDLHQDIFPLCGVKWNATENIVLYNHRTGVLLVRASQEDLDTIRAVIETLGGAAADNAARGNPTSDPSFGRGGGGSPSSPTKQ